MSAPPSPLGSLEERIAEARRHGRFEPITDAIPYAAFLGLEVLVAGPELITCMRFAPHLVGNPTLPALHGGTIGALLEHAAVFQLIWDPEIVPLPKTINLTVEYLRSARPRDAFARAEITKRGRRVANVHVTAWQDDRRRPIAAANAHFLLRPATPAPVPEPASEPPVSENR